MTPDDLERLDRAHVWHPFAPMAEWLSEPPLVIDRAEGHELIDVRGRRYLDGVSSLWLNVHGHRHPTIDAAVRTQLDKVAHTTLLGLASTPSILLAERLARLAPSGLDRVFFSDSGSTAVEVALKIAFQHHQLRGQRQRTKFLALTNAYHGDTLGSVSVGGIDVFHQIFAPLLFHTIHVPPDIGAVEAALAEHGDNLAAFIVEPLVQGAAGMLLQERGFLAAAARACRDRGVLLIADEVATGFGRTGTLFACEQEGVVPDLLCIAKGLSGGYLPVAATLVQQQVFEPFLGAPDERLTFFHGHSFGGNPLACAAALGSLDVFESERTLERLQPKIAHLVERLAARVAPLPHVFQIRQRGFMVGIELREDRRHPYPASLAMGHRVCRLARALGVLLRPLGNVVVLMPPLSLSLEELDRLVDVTARAIEEGTRAPIPTTLPPASPAVVASPAASSLHGFVVLGTDTGVGKTTFGRALLALARRRGLPLRPSKPVETGVEPGAPRDASRLQQASATLAPLATVGPFAFRMPAAPSVAAAAEGQTLDLPTLERAVRDAAGGDPVLVELAGGLLTPLTATATCADFAARLRLPVLLVARNGLGTINHTALALAELRRRGLAPLGVVLVDVDARTTPDRATNAAAIAALTGLTPLGCLPFADDASDDVLAALLERHVDVAPLFAAFGRSV